MVWESLPPNNTEEDVVLLSYITTTATIAALVQETNPLPRGKSVFDSRLDWKKFVRHKKNRKDFQRHLRMKYSSFKKLLNYIRADLLVNEEMGSLRGGAVIPEVCLYATLRYLAGGSYSDIHYFTGISRTAFYDVVNKTMHAIINCKQLAIKFPTTRAEVEEAANGFCSVSSAPNCMWNVATVLDGYHLEIKVPAKKDAKNVKSFFSGHYQSYGVNVQAACDHQCRFQFLGVAGPGVMGDREAVFELELGDLVEGLPAMYCAISDCAYTPTEKMVPVFGGQQALRKRNDNFNFYASQLRIRIEMAFGMMTMKWCILQHPLMCKLEKVKYVITCVAMLHNFCINERLLQEGASATVRHNGDIDLPIQIQALRQAASEIDLDDMEQNFESGHSNNRERMVSDIQTYGYTRPGAHV